MRLSPVLPFLVLLLMIAHGCGPSLPNERPWTVAELGVEVADTSREVSFTNTKAGFYYTESNGPHRSSWQGWHVSSVKILSDYRIELGNELLERTAGVHGTVWPHELTRTYPGGQQETFIFFDSLDAFMVSLSNLRTADAALSLVFDPSSAIESAAPDGEGLVVFSPFSSVTRRNRPDVPGWIGLASLSAEARTSDSLLQDGGRIIAGRVTQPVVDGAAAFVVAAGPDPAHVRTTLARLRAEHERYREERISRMEAVLNQSYVRTSDGRFDKALAWAKLSMDALIMEQGRKGIFAGLPWFSNYWGRDTFISLPGATLVVGRYDDARNILASFARWQNTDARSPNEGRVPNIVTPTSLAYNTTDGTPWFVLGVHGYVMASGDTAFAREIYPVLKRAADGPMRHRTDRHGFLTHDDAETWMDAVGPEGPWSPRGNRANDIQALWYWQLSASSALASLLGMDHDAERWGLAADEVLFAFRQEFIADGDSLVYDHLNVDDSPDLSVRPNQLFALDIVPDTELQARIFARLTRELVYPYGVGSLSPLDENFHPYHHYQPFYVQDAAYHNGIVWTWQNGPWIEHAVRLGRTDLASEVTDGMVHQILDRGAVGTISELLDAAPRPGETEPRLSGTFSQAWSLAEFIRTAYASYFGITVDAINRQVWLKPHLPASMRSADLIVPVGPNKLRVTYGITARSAAVTLDGRDITVPHSVSCSWTFSNGRERSVSVSLMPGEEISLVITPDAASATSQEGEPVDADTQVRTLPSYAALVGLTLASPLVRPDLRSLTGPSYELLPHAVVRTAPEGTVVLMDATDPKGDDSGTGSYSYPSTTHLRKGSLDLTGLTVSKGDSLVHFRLKFAALSDPGWHPEYGFQLTYAAIAIDKDGIPGSGTRRVGRNAQYDLARGWEHELVIYVGGGMQVENAAGEILGAYLPSEGDEKDPIGNAALGIVSFSIPTRMIGIPSKEWRYTVLVGAQDDHGGAGIGEFRSVDNSGGEWIGGGKERASDPNVYDVMRVQ